jgi:uncharacterized membrane protein YqiK
MNYNRALKMSVDVVVEKVKAAQAANAEALAKNEANMVAAIAEADALRNKALAEKKAERAWTVNYNFATDCSVIYDRYLAILGAMAEDVIELTPQEFNGMVNTGVSKRAVISNISF